MWPVNLLFRQKCFPFFVHVCLPIDKISLSMRYRFRNAHAAIFTFYDVTVSDVVNLSRSNKGAEIERRRVLLRLQNFRVTEYLGSRQSRGFSLLLHGRLCNRTALDGLECPGQGG